MADSSGGEQHKRKPTAARVSDMNTCESDDWTVLSNMEWFVIILSGLKSNYKYLQQMCVSEWHRWKWFQLKSFFSCFQLLLAVTWNKRELMEVRALKKKKYEADLSFRAVG